ncbi:butyrophilin subfamily 1 member A1-like [Chanos chanos]|uniref:Butyrophilin subfamily 1 member A1-like n=1 Tax=Chanos chanos TaxID=29144 RepID=A0A6J2VST5_CHACN|nr:butyrophilin subfamily 1 member A1-like [Chanos chanos]
MAPSETLLEDASYWDPGGQRQNPETQERTQPQRCFDQRPGFATYCFLCSAQVLCKPQLDFLQVLRPLGTSPDEIPGASSRETNDCRSRVMTPKSTDRDKHKQSELGLTPSPDSDKFQVVGPDGPLVVGAGEDVILPCSLKPNISAVDMTVQWFRLHTSDLLLHFYEGGAESKDQIQSYRGRTSLFKEELQKGNASLKLSRVKVSDEGEYRCIIQSKNWIDDISFKISVGAVGTYPVVFMEGYSIGKGLSLLCEIKGWNPEPEVLWLDSDGNLLPAEDTETLRDPERFHVKKHVTVQDSNTNRFYCRAILRDHMREAEIIISSQVFHTWRSRMIWISVLASVIITGLIIIVCSSLKIKEKERQIDEEFKRTKRKYAMAVTLDPDTAHPNLILSDDGQQVTYGFTPQILPNNPKRFKVQLSVLGKEGFSSGRFYYEVQVSSKAEWYLGVVRESVNRKRYIALSPTNGYWVMCLWNGTRYKAFAGPPVLSLKQKPQKVGVFVDYKEGLVSFYDVETRSHIYSFTGQTFTGKLYPYFSPCSSFEGKNSAPLIITPVNQIE